MTHMVLFLWHSDQIVRVRASSTCECDGSFTQQGLSSRGRELARRPLPHFAAPGVPLPSASPYGSEAPGDSRSQECFHGKNINIVNPPSPAASASRRRHYQPVGGSGSAALLERASRSWLSASLNAKSAAKTNTCMIVCRRKKCRRFITGWCQTSLRRSKLTR